jgi:hypothetical protein
VVGPLRTRCVSAHAAVVRPGREACWQQR